MIFGKNVNKYYLRYWYLLLIGIIALIFVDYFQLLIPDIMGDIIDGLKAIIDPTNAMTEPLNLETLKSFMITMFVIVIVMFSGRFLWRITVFGLSVRVETAMRDEMFAHSEKLSREYYNVNKTGALMALFTNDLQTIRNSFGSGVVMMVDAIFLGGLSFYKMFTLDITLSLISTIPLFLLALCGGIIGRQINKRFTLRQEAFAEMSDITQENFSGITVIKAFVKEKKEFIKFAKVNAKNKDTNIRLVKFFMILSSIISLLIGSIMVIILSYGGYLVYTSEGAFTVGKLTKFCIYFTTLVWPIMALAQLINMRSQAKASLKRINELLCHKVEINDDLADITNKEVIGGITFKEFNFTYPGADKPALKNINIDIKPGEKIGIIGKTGSGKTTFVDMLLRLYNVEEGHIFIDGADIMHLPLQTVRDAIGYVPQDNFLYSDTISHNIAFALKDEDLEEIKKFAKYAAVDDNIEEFPEKYDTILGERGVTLSGGQRQRISIARALIKNPKILILDDSVSAVDTNTEKTILESINELRENKTTILIAHRISTVRDLDRIMIIDEGEVTAFGTHHELMESSTDYQALVNLQKLEDEIGGTNNA